VLSGLLPHPAPPAAPRGHSLLQDFHLIDKLAHFDRERIPERVVHAKGAGAHGYFEVTSPVIAQYTKAKLFSAVGKRTPTFLRFSTVGGEKGSADTDRDPRGFALKFYTEEGMGAHARARAPAAPSRGPVLTSRARARAPSRAVLPPTRRQLGHDRQQHPGLLHPRPVQGPLGTAAPSPG